MSGIAPIRNTLNAPFWDGAERGTLTLPFCAASNRAFWPPSTVSPYVNGGRVEWRKAEPVGVVRALVVHQRSFNAAFEPRMPYGIALVELDAGPRLQIHFAGADAPRHGDRVRIAFEKLSDAGGLAPVARKT